MIISDEDAKDRIESPLNLLNRLRTTVNRHPIHHPTQHPSLPPSAEEIIKDLDDKIKNTTAKSKANSIMIAAMDELHKRIPEVQKPEKLAQIASDMSKVISNHESKGGGTTNNSQIIIYAPQVQSLDNFDIIDVAE